MPYEQLQVWFGYAAGALVPAATAMYVLGVLRKKIIPSRTTWVIWTLLAAILSAGMYHENTLNPQIVMVLFGNFFIVGLAVKYGNWTGTRLDAICTVLAIGAIVLWQLTDSAIFAIVMTLVATIIGFVPLAYNVWMNPAHERPSPWLIMLASTIFQMLALKEWTFAAYAQPIVYLIVPLTVIVLLLRPRVMQAI